MLRTCNTVVFKSFLGEKSPRLELPGGNLNQLRASQIFTALLFTFIARPVFAESNPSIGQTSYFNIPESDDKVPLSQDLEAELSFSLTGRRYDDAIVNSRWGRAAIGLDMKKKFTSYLSGRLAVEQRFTGGASSNYYAVTEGSASPQSTLIDEAALILIPSTYFKATAGIAPVGLNPVYSAMNVQSWLSLKLQSDIPAGNHSIKLSASQSTPSSGGVSNRTVDDGTLPLFTQGTVTGELNPNEDLRLRAGYTSFVFTDPSSRTAEDSRYNGSTILGNGPYIFAYDFKGSEVAADVKVKLFLDDELTAKAAHVRNDLAPNGANTGTGWRVEYKKIFNKYEVTGALNGFRVETDAIPSSYGIEFSGFTNRVGQGVSFKIVIPKQNTSFMAGYANADVLNKAATSAGTQANREVYTLKTEITYDLF